MDESILNRLLKVMLWKCCEHTPCFGQTFAQREASLSAFKMANSPQKEAVCALVEDYYNNITACVK